MERPHKGAKMSKPTSDLPVGGELTAEQPWLVRVTDLKQWAYCPRVVYYQYCLPGIRPVTFKMEMGIEAQDRVEGLEARRSLRAYGVAHGVRHFNVSVVSHRLQCTAQVDMVIETESAPGEAEIIPVDFKLSRRDPGRNFKLQVACYGIMLAEAWGIPAHKGYLYLIPQRRAEEVKFTPRLRKDAEKLLTEIRATVMAQRVPPATSQRRRCVDCEFRRFCNDVF